MWVGCYDTGEFLRVVRGGTITHRVAIDRGWAIAPGSRRSRRAHAVHGHRRDHFRRHRRPASRRDGSCRRVSTCPGPARRSASLGYGRSRRLGAARRARSRLRNVRCGWPSSTICSRMYCGTKRVRAHATGLGDTRRHRGGGARSGPARERMLLVLHLRVRLGRRRDRDAHRCAARADRVLDATSREAFATWLASVRKPCRTCRPQTRTLAKNGGARLGHAEVGGANAVVGQQVSRNARPG